MRLCQLDVGILLLLTGFISAMLFFIQRSEVKRRLIVIVIMLIPAELIRRYVFYASRTALLSPFTDLAGNIAFQHALHRSIHREAWIALGLALFLNFAFWLFIGRYNPVRSSDEIRVIGMDE